MKSITIHGLDDTLDRLIRKKAKKQGKSLNKTIKTLLEESLGIDKKKPSDNRDDFMDLFGIWTKQQAKQYLSTLTEFDIIDKEEWK